MSIGARLGLPVYARLGNSRTAGTFWDRSISGRLLFDEPCRNSVDFRAAGRSLLPPVFLDERSFAGLRMGRTMNNGTAGKVLGAALFRSDFRANSGPALFTEHRALRVQALGG